MATLTVQSLKQINEGEKSEFNGIFLVRNVKKRTARNGNEFLSIEFGDDTGSFNANCFNDAPFFQTLVELPQDSVVLLKGRTDHYQGRVSPRINAIEPIPQDDPQYMELMGKLIERSPEDPDTLWNELQQFIADLSHQPMRDTVNAALEEVGDSFRTSTAAIAMHHAYRHGLLEHTIHLCRAAKALLPLYPEVDHDLTIAGCILHDIGKTLEYDSGVSTRKTRTGILQGHVVLGYRIARKAGIQSKLDSDRLERLEHIILSHQGEMEWGAAAMASTPEAVFVSMIDNLDAKMGMVQRALRQATEGDQFGEFLPGLQTQPLVEPLQSIEEQSP